MYIIHRSMIHQFVSEKMLLDGTDGSHVAGMSLAEMLAEPDMEEMFSSTFAVVGADATLEEAKNAMTRIVNCQDVLVTRTGNRDEPVLGWLTNSTLATAELR